MLQFLESDGGGRNGVRWFVPAAGYLDLLASFCTHQPENVHDQVLAYGVITVDDLLILVFY